MTKAWQLASLLIFTVTLNAGAQRAQAPKPHTRSGAATTKPSKPQSLEAERKDDLNHFRGIATKLNTTPDALEAAYQAAQQANPKLTRGQFIAANVLAQNLGSKNPAITTAAILDGLQSHKSIGQTLQSLGLSKSAANEAEEAAEREVKEADKAAKAQPKDKDPDTKSSTL